MIEEVTQIGQPLYIVIVALNPYSIYDRYLNAFRKSKSYSYIQYIQNIQKKFISRMDFALSSD